MTEVQAAPEVVPTAQIQRAIEECRQLLVDIDEHKTAMEQGWMTGQTRLAQTQKKRDRLRERTLELLSALEAAGERPLKSKLMPVAQTYIQAARVLQRYLGVTQKFSEHRLETIFWLIDYNQEE